MAASVPGNLAKTIADVSFCRFSWVLKKRRSLEYLNRIAIWLRLTRLSSGPFAGSDIDHDLATRQRGSSIDGHLALFGFRRVSGTLCKKGNLEKLVHGQRVESCVLEGALQILMGDQLTRTLM